LNPCDIFLVYAVTRTPTLFGWLALCLFLVDWQPISKPVISEGVRRAVVNNATLCGLFLVGDRIG